MALTLKQRVEALTGTLSSDYNDHVSTGLQGGARCVINYLPMFDDYVTSYGVTSGTDITNYRILAITRNGRMAHQVSIIHLSDLSDPNSLHYATEYDPGYTLNHRVIQMFPGGGDPLLWGLLFPPLLHSDTEDAYDELIEEGSVLYCALYILMRVRGAEIALLAAESVTLPSVPTPPAAPSFTYTDAVSGSATTVTVSTFGDVPVFDISGIARASTPFGPSFAWIDPAVYTVGSPALLDLTATLSTIVTYINTDEDIELAREKINEAKTRIDEWTAETQLTLQALISDAKERNETSRLSELQRVQTAVAEYSAKLQLYANDIQFYVSTVQEAKARFDADVVLFQADIQKKITEAQLAGEQVRLNAQLTTNVNIQNESKELERQISEYAAKLNLFSSQVQAYGTEVQGAIGKYTADISKHIQVMVGIDGQIKNTQEKWIEYLTLKLKVPLK